LICYRVKPSLKLRKAARLEPQGQKMSHPATAPTPPHPSREIFRRKPELSHLRPIPAGMAKSSHIDADCPRPPIRLHPELKFFTSAEDIMANDHAEAGHPDMDYAEHERTYALFLSLIKIGSTIVIAIMIFMAVTLL
jgi:hypothetical protein